MELFNKSFLIASISLCLFSNSLTMEEECEKSYQGEDYKFGQNSNTLVILASQIGNNNEVSSEPLDDIGVGFNDLPSEIQYMIIKEFIKKLITKGLSRKRLVGLFLISKEFYDHMNHIFNKDPELVNDILDYRKKLNEAEEYIKELTDKPKFYHTNKEEKLSGLLYRAIQKNEFSKVLLLLMGGANVKYYEKSLLINAAISGFNQIVEILLYHADTSSINEALIAITHKWNQKSGLNREKNRWTDVDGVDRKEIINTLLAHPATDINAVCPQLFFYVAKRGYKELVEKLLTHIADIDMRDDDGNTALILAAQSDYDDVVEFLLVNHADANIQNKYGNTALIFASGGNCTNTVQLLLENNADIDKQNHEGWTALMFTLGSVKYGHTEEIIKILLKANANLNLQNDNRETALIIVCKYNREDERLILTKIITRLLNAHADIKKRDNNGKSALDYAKEHNDHRIENLLNQANSWCILS